jgi:hypothetical protein
LVNVFFGGLYFDLRFKRITELLLGSCFHQLGFGFRLTIAFDDVIKTCGLVSRGVSAPLRDGLGDFDFIGLLGFWWVVGEDFTELVLRLRFFEFVIDVSFHSFFGRVLPPVADVA